MAVSEAHKRASAKYDKKHMDTIGIKGKKDIIQNIKQYAKNNNISLNRLCIGCVLYCIEHDIDISGYTRQQNTQETD